MNIYKIIVNVYWNLHVGEVIWYNMYKILKKTYNLIYMKSIIN
jgi:hypothetical protein